MLLSSGELFHRAELRRLPRRRLGKAIDSFLELREGDLVVHVAHGIARYRGLKLLEKDGQVEEHLELEFHGGTKLYVPGLEDRPGAEVRRRHEDAGRRWPSSAARPGCGRSRRPRRPSIDLAADMLELQAARAARPGIAFPADTDWQREFDASFPYQRNARPADRHRGDQAAT